MKPKNSPAQAIGITFCLILFAVAGLASVKRLAIYDWLSLRGYQAPAAVASLATQDTMTPQAEHIFYVNRPEIQDRDAFNQSCPNNGGEHTIILGCYKAPQRGIYVYNVSDSELDGVQQVTAAHEMLHAAYGRMSASEKKKVNAMLESYYQHDLKDKRLLSVIDEYKKTEPNDVVDEMHSIFGTEIASLPAGLEDHYKAYFSDRQKVVAFATRYRGAFDGREAQVEQIKAQLSALEKKIEANNAELDRRAAELNAQRQRLQSQGSSGSAAAYNAQVDGFNAQVKSYNVLVAQTQAEIKQYNDLVATSNSISTQINNLNNAISSQPQTQSAQ